MANDTIYDPGDKSYSEVLYNYFPELSETGHYDFNEFLAQHPELQGRTDIYNVLGGMDVATRIQPGEKEIGYDWSDPYSLSGLGGLYSLWDSFTTEDQSLKEGFADWYRNMKGIGIQRDALGLLYDKDEADYYKGYYKKMQKDYQKMQADRWQKEKMRRLTGEPIVGGTIDRPGRIPPVKIRRENIMPSGGEQWSPGVGGRDLSPGGGYGQSPTGSDIAGTPFSRGGIVNLL